MRPTSSGIALRRTICLPRWFLFLGLYVVTAPWCFCQERDRSQAESGPEPLPVEAPQDAEIVASLDRGIQFLLSSQNEDGSWGSATQTKELNIYAPVPGAHHAFRSAVTALCVAALVDMKRDNEEVRGSIDRGEKWLLDRLPKLRRATGDALYNVWGHAYGIEALVRLFHYRAGDEEKQKRIVEEIDRQVELLGRYETTKGGWGYYDFHMHMQRPTADPTSFTTATVLYAFHQAQGIGVKIPESLIKRGLEVIKRQQRPDLAYLYAEDFRTNPGREINKPGGSVGRSQACNLALRLYGDSSVTDKAMVAWAKRLYARNLWLDIGRKRPVPHESWFLVAGYFFYYGTSLYVPAVSKRRKHWSTFFSAPPQPCPPIAQILSQASSPP